jgi:hypothetical protein
MLGYRTIEWARLGFCVSFECEWMRATRAVKQHHAMNTITSSRGYKVFSFVIISSII